jgi:hypothetical protein
MSESDRWSGLLVAPRNFLHGFLGGLFGPVLALAAAVGVIYLATRRLPAFREVASEAQGRERAIILSSPLEARASWARYWGDLRGAILELRARARTREQV